VLDAPGPYSQGNSRYHRTFAAALLACWQPGSSGLARPRDGGWPAGHWAPCWQRQLFLPALGNVFADRARGRLLSFRRLSAAANLHSRGPALLVSVSELRIWIADRGQ
jgi:hypothetical protein